MTHDTIVVFARAPVLGQVKTRLAREIGDEAALTAYTELARQCWHTVQATQSATGCRTVVSFTPSEGGDAVRTLLTNADTYVPQEGSDLGERMSGAIADALGQGSRRVLVVGTDCPELSSGVLADGLAALDGADVVLGPATDGGYYLVGMSASHPAVFVDVPWSCEHTLAVTLERAAQAGLRVALLEPLSDVDTAEDWRAWRDRTDQGA